MSLKLPSGRSTAESANDLVLALVTSGHFNTTDKSHDEIFQMIEDAEQAFFELYEHKKNLLLDLADERRRRIDANINKYLNE